jgi:hypothetical protein
MLETLRNAAFRKQLILFVGSGISANLGLPTWNGLVDEIAHQLDFDPEVFQTHGDFLALAEYYKIKKVSIGQLRSWMDRNWHKDETIVDTSTVHQAIVDLNCPLIYTTNYDRWIEYAFRRRKQDFTKIANVGDFVGIRDGVTQIVKFHGDFDDDNSLVLTESSYFERLSFESPLDIKFRSDSVGRSILFIGYSLTDINIRYLLHKLRSLWRSSGYESARPESFIFLSRPNPIQEEIFLNMGIIPIVSNSDSAGTGISEFLVDLVRGA